jgi:hypothetical protein
MALITCEECEHRISQSAMSCPACGARTRHARQLLGGLVAVVLALLFIYVLGLTVASESRVAAHDTPTRDDHRLGRRS